MNKPLAACLVALAAACSDPATNPDVLWLALDGSEIRVKLVGVEPQPF